VDLVTYLLERARDPRWRAVILAHPCSGTTWLCDTMRALGVPANHELLRPADGDPRVLVTFRALGFAPLRAGEERLHLVRDPARVVQSAAVLFAQRPRVARDIYAQILNDGLSINLPAVGQMGPLALAAWTLSVFNQRAEERTEYRFRIEDVGHRTTRLDAEIRANSHVGDRGPAQGLRWEDLQVFVDPLQTQRRRYGYA